MSKKILGMALALLLVVAMTVNVFAALVAESGGIGNVADFSDLIELGSEEETTQKPKPPVSPTAQLLAQWHFDEMRGETVTDSIGNKTATLQHASLEAGISGNGVRLDAGKSGRIDFGERGLTSLVEGKEQYSVSMWVLPSYYAGAATQRLFTMGADAEGKALLDIHLSKNNFFPSGEN